jgi:APA family basic amino acid/polyamine antiporter
VLELALGGAVVSVGCSKYLQSLFDTMGIHLPGSLAGENATFNQPAFLLVLVLTGVCYASVRLSSRVTAVIVTVKVAVVLFVIVAGLFFIKSANYTPFVPPSKASESSSGQTQPLIQAIAGVAPGNYGVIAADERRAAVAGDGRRR